MAFVDTHTLTLTPQETERLNALVGELVRSRFGEGQIERVFAEVEQDDDGDQFLSVTVVFNPQAGALDAERTLGLARHLRPRLEAERVAGFPVFRFLSKQEAVEAA